jgi:hypothetical protein
MTTLMTPEQCRAARGLLRQSQTGLVREAGLGISTLIDFEKRRYTIAPESILRMQRALEAAGVDFIKGGVKLKEREPSFPTDAVGAEGI